MPTTAADHPPIEAHDELSRRLLEHAEAMIAEGDRLQASEKVWGAVAHKIKAIAAERGWSNRSHVDTQAIVRHVAAQPGNRRISHLFRASPRTRTGTSTTTRRSSRTWPRILPKSKSCSIPFAAASAASDAHR